MAQDAILRSMLKALADVREEGDTFVTSDDWDVTVHAGRQGAGFTVPHVVKIALRTGYVILETTKGQRFVMVDEDIRAFAQEPSQGERKGRKAGFV